MSTVTVTTKNGIVYTKKQIQGMFAIQVESLLKQCDNVNKEIVEKWINEGY